MGRKCLYRTQKSKRPPRRMAECLILCGRASGSRTPDLRIKSPSCKTRLLLNQLLATLANSQPNVTHGTINVARAYRVTITSQCCLCNSSVGLAPRGGQNGELLVGQGPAESAAPPAGKLW